MFPLKIWSFTSWIDILVERDSCIGARESWIGTRESWIGARESWIWAREKCIGAICSNLNSWSWHFRKTSYSSRARKQLKIKYLLKLR
jgi:hypothetical protein